MGDSLMPGPILNQGMTLRPALLSRKRRPASGGIPAPVLARPTIASASTVTLAWTGGTGSDTIQRSTNAGGAWANVATGQASPYTATSQTEITSQDVWYRVKAGGTSDPSNSGIVRLFTATDGYTAPAGSTSHLSQAYGNGADGATDGTGGGGGAFAMTASTLSGAYEVHIASDYSYLSNGGGFVVMAPGASGSTGGDGPSGTGDLKRSGGNGGTGGGSGGGGGGAGPIAAGTSGANGPNGAGGVGGGGLAGAGGTGSDAGSGDAGVSFGGGGGGANSEGVGGAGAPGAIAVSCVKAA